MGHLGSSKYGIRKRPPINPQKTLIALIYLPSGRGPDRRQSGPHRAMILNAKSNTHIKIEQGPGSMPIHSLRVQRCPIRRLDLGTQPLYASTENFRLKERSSHKSAPKLFPSTSFTGRPPLPPPLTVRNVGKINLD
jgi:hypothetical protein